MQLMIGFQTLVLVCYVITIVRCHATRRAILYQLCDLSNLGVSSET